MRPWRRGERRAESGERRGLGAEAEPWRVGPFLTEIEVKAGTGTFLAGERDSKHLEWEPRTHGRNGKCCSAGAEDPGQGASWSQGGGGGAPA